MRRTIQASLFCSFFAGSAFSVLAQAQFAQTPLIQAPLSQGQALQTPMQPLTAAINYPQFLRLSEEVQAYREDHLVSKTSFLEMANEPGTLILDTRSKAAFDQGHIEGAVHLNFSDFTEEKLAQVIGDKNRRILIYCNNNFAENERPFARKSVELALNIPTFINLYGYGYKNVFELQDSVSVRDPEMKIVSTPL